MNLSLADWEIAKLQHMMPALSPLGGLRVPIGGTVEFALDTENGELQGARVDLNSGAGTLVDPSLSAGAVPVESASLSASYDPAAATLTLHKLALDLAGPSASVSGTVGGLAPDWLWRGIASEDAVLTVAIDAEVSAMPANDLARFWPTPLASNARAWVTTNIRDGVIDEARLTSKLRASRDSLDVTALDAFGGSLRMRGLTVDYKRPLPPVLKVDGSATFDGAHMELFPTSGALKGQRITGGKIIITDLDKADQYIDIKLDVSGPLRDALEVIDAKPLRYAHEVGIDPAAVDGSADGRLAFKFSSSSAQRSGKSPFSRISIRVICAFASIAVRCRSMVTVGLAVFRRRSAGSNISDRVMASAVAIRRAVNLTTRRAVDSASIYPEM